MTPKKASAAQQFEQLEEALRVHQFQLHVGPVDREVYLHGAHGAIQNQYPDVSTTES